MPSSNLTNRSKEMAQKDVELAALSDTGITADQPLEVQGIGVSDAVGELHAAPKELPPSELQKIRQLIFRTLLIVGIVIVVWGAIRYAPTLAVFALMALMSYAGVRSVVRERNAQIICGIASCFNLETAVDRSLPLAKPHEYSLFTPRPSSSYE